MHNATYNTNYTKYNTTYTTTSYSAADGASDGSFGVPLGPLVVDPLLLLQLDWRTYNNEVEGTDGFMLSRMRVGGRVRYGSTLSSTIIAEIARERPQIVDAFISYLPIDSFEVNAGFSKSALIWSGREPIAVMAFGERSTWAQAFWPGRDLGIEAHLLPVDAPVELWLRVGNGNESALGNDLGGGLAAEGRADLVLGNARTQPAWRHSRGNFADEDWGFRLGAGARIEDAGERQGIKGTTSTGFTFAPAPSVIGPRWIAEGHTVASLGPVMVVAEGAYAQESRSIDDDGRPDTPRQNLDAITSYGGSLELNWSLFGQPRVGGWWLGGPSPYNTEIAGAVELSLRGERNYFKLGASDVTPAGNWGAAGALTWWINHNFSIGGQVYANWYDVAPVEDPNQLFSYTALLRTTVSVR